MSHVSTHVLDAANGRPAVGMQVTLSSGDGTAIATAPTDSDGRISALGPDTLAPGDYRLAFDTGGWFGDTPHFFSRVTIDFTLADAGSHYHVPLLLSPFAYSTYRGS